MSKVTEIVFPDNEGANGDGFESSITPISTDGWFEGYGDMLTIDDLAAILHVSRKTAQNQCKRGDLPAVPIGRRWYVPKARLVEMLMTGRKPNAAE